MATNRSVHALDLRGQTFSRWIVLKKSEKRGKSGEIYWECKCTCGNVKDITASSLRNGKSRSCGCYSKEISTRHGMEGTPTYNTWAHMLTRCRNVGHKQYLHYGGRGISVSERWEEFDNFLMDMWKKPAGMSLDRIDNDGNYEPDNCRWATYKEQNRNRRKTPFYEWGGRKMALADICDKVGLPRKRVYNRLKSGMSLADALSPYDRRASPR